MAFEQVLNVLSDWKADVSEPNKVSDLCLFNLQQLDRSS